MTTTTADEDPFRDPSLHPAPDTLAVGRNASLTLGTDSLVVLGMYSCPAPFSPVANSPTTDESLLESNNRRCCGVAFPSSMLFPSAATRDRH